MRERKQIFAFALTGLGACTGDDLPTKRHPPRPTDTADTRHEDTLQDTADTTTPSPCPADMALVDSTAPAPFCMDLYEAPGRAGALPFVMFNLLEASSWCEARDKRLCWDDEWQAACEGNARSAYPYGDQRHAGVCNDEETWLTYTQSLLDLWPWTLDTTPLETLDDLWAAVRATGTNGASAADHVLSLYQGEGSGENTGCTNETTILDTIGNVEEWTLRRDGGATDFHGNLKGRYWADTRTCQDNITSHGDAFRFYEIGFRCCQTPSGT